MFCKHNTCSFCALHVTFVVPFSWTLSLEFFFTMYSTYVVNHFTSYHNYYYFPDCLNRNICKQEELNTLSKIPLIHWKK